MYCWEKKVTCGGLVFLSIAVFLNSAVTAQSHDTARKRKELQELGEKCREVWYEGNEDLPLVAKLALFKNLTADRDLSEQEMECLLGWSDHLIDKDLNANWTARQAAARYLGDLGHMYGIPALLAVLRDHSDEPRFRASCVVGLSRIADDRVVDPLIDALTDPDAGVAWLAHEKLTEIMHTSIPGPDNFRDLEPDSPERKLYQSRWRDWWNKYRDEVTPDRANPGWPPNRIYREEDFPLNQKAD